MPRIIQQGDPVAEFDVFSKLDYRRKIFAFLATKFRNTHKAPKK